jgi:hypothetical protein
MHFINAMSKEVNAVSKDVNVVCEVLNAVSEHLNGISEVVNVVSEVVNAVSKDVNVVCEVVNVVSNPLNTVRNNLNGESGPQTVETETRNPHLRRVSNRKSSIFNRKYCPPDVGGSTLRNNVRPDRTSANLRVSRRRESERRCRCIARALPQPRSFLSIDSGPCREQ